MINIPCELCGKSEGLVRAIVEGTELTVCSACGRFGQILAKPKIIPKVQKKVAVVEVEFGIVDDYSKLIKDAREKRGLKQEEAAIAMNEKESILSKIEAGKQKPSIDLAKKLEKFFHITLIEEVKAESMTLEKSTLDGLTIADFIKK